MQITPACKENKHEEFNIEEKGSFSFKKAFSCAYQVFLRKKTMEKKESEARFKTFRGPFC